MDRHTGTPGITISVSIPNLARLRVRATHALPTGRPVGEPCSDDAFKRMSAGDS